jgi:hypothetical protein
MPVPQPQHGHRPGPIPGPAIPRRAGPGMPRQLLVESPGAAPGAIGLRSIHRFDGAIVPGAGAPSGGICCPGLCCSIPSPCSVPSIPWFCPYIPYIIMGPPQPGRLPPISLPMDRGGIICGYPRAGDFQQQPSAAWAAPVSPNSTAMARQVIPIGFITFLLTGFSYRFQ